MHKLLEQCDEVVECVNDSIEYVMESMGHRKILSEGEAEYLCDLSYVLKNFAKVKHYAAKTGQEHMAHANKTGTGAAASHNPY